MQLTRSADYAVRAMLDIAAQGNDHRVRTHEIADRQDIPAALLAKLVPVLVRAGLLHSQRGAQGGVLLARPAEQINVRQIVEAVEGPIALNRCLETPSQCDRIETCPVYPMWLRAQNNLIDILETTLLTQLLEAAPAFGLQEEPEPVAD